MSELEKKSVSGAGPGSSVVMVESPGNKYLQSFRHTELQEESPPDIHHKRSRAPAVPSVAEELKNISEDIPTNDNAGNKERKDTEREHEKQKRSASKKLSSSTKRRGSSPETITLAPIEVDTKKAIENVARQPIPPEVEAVASAAFAVAGSKQPKQSNFEDDSITEEVAELRTEGKKREWSDDEEEAGGLPRSDSRSSRVSRTIRQLFCCGVRLEAPSEDNLSSPRDQNAI